MAKPSSDGLVQFVAMHVIMAGVWVFIFLLCHGCV